MDNNNSINRVASDKFSLQKKLLLSSIISGLTLTNSPYSIAQEPDSLMLEEVVVTAQKKSESLQDVPIAVSAFSSDQLQQRGLVGGGDLAQAVPNISFVGNTGYGGVNFQIRGIGAQLESVTADSGVGIHVNSIPLTISRFAAAEFYDVNRVEVLRGPQGTLYGRNSTGGVVNLLTNAPEADFSARINAEYGNYNTKRFSGHVNVPLSDTFAVRAAGFSLGRDGTVKNVGTGNDVDDREIWSGRLSAAWEPSDMFSANVMYEHFEQNDTSGGNRKVICASDPGPTEVGGVPTNPFTQSLLSEVCLNTNANDPSNNGGIISGANIAGLLGFFSGVAPFNVYAGQTFSTDLRTVNSTRDALAIADNDLFTIDLQFDLGNGLSITSLSSYSEDNARTRFGADSGVPDPSNVFPDTPLTPGGVFNDPQLGPLTHTAMEGHTTSQTEQYSQELRLQSDYEGDVNFSVGGIYLDVDRNNSVSIVGNTLTMSAVASNLGLGPAGPAGVGVYIEPGPEVTSDGRNYVYLSTDYRLKAAALFGELYYDISDDVKATLGLRYTRDDKESTSYAPGFGVPGRGLTTGNPTQNTVFNELTGRFTLDWQINNDHLAYVSLSRGYKGGGFNPGGLAGARGSETFDPELVNAIEIGTKSTIADGRGTINFTGFGYDYTGYQISSLNSGAILNENVDATIWGLEIESNFLVTQAFQIDTTLGYVNSSIGDVESVDTYNRTQGDPNYTAVLSLHPDTLASGCAVPTVEVAQVQSLINDGSIPPELAPFAFGGFCSGPGASQNAVVGLPADLEGNDLPLVPEITVSIGAQYTMTLSDNWQAVVRGDYAYRSSSFARIYNEEMDRIDSNDNLNLSMVLSSPDSGLEIQLYARNLLSQNTVTSIFAIGDQPGQYREVTGKDPEMYGIRVSKSW